MKAFEDMQKDSEAKGATEEFARGLQSMMRTLKKFYHTFDQVYAALVSDEHYANVTKEEARKYY